MPLKAGIVQLSPFYGRVSVNLDRLEEAIEAAADQGAELVVLPEMAWTGYLWPHRHQIAALAETAGAGPGQDRLAALARRRQLWIVFGFPEVDGDRLFNAQAVVAPDGEPRPVYRKGLLFEADAWWAEPGDTGYRQWASPWGLLGSGICMDLNAEGFADWHGAHGTDVLVFSTNWLDQGFDVLPYWEQRLAGDQGIPFLGTALFANRGGAEFGVAYRGQSAGFRGGRVVRSLSGTDEGILIVEG